jgi:hypothetical protein
MEQTPMTFRYGQQGFTDSVTQVWTPYAEEPSNEPGWKARDAEVAGLEATISELRAQLDGSATPADAALIDRARRDAPARFGADAPRLETQLADALAAAAWREASLREQIEKSPESLAAAAARDEQEKVDEASGLNNF